MSERRHTPDDQAPHQGDGLAQVAADDLLLDTLAGGDAGLDDDDPAARLLAAWHADLSADLPDLDLSDVPGVDSPSSPAPSSPSASSSSASSSSASSSSASSSALGSVEGGAGPGGVVSLEERRRRRFGPVRKALVGAAAAAVIATGLAVGAHSAQPGDPLFPITEVVYRQQAQERSAEHAIAQARAALDAGRPAEARRLLGVAAGHVAKIQDETVRTRLQGEIDALLRRLDTQALAPTPEPTAGPPAPTTKPPARPTPAPTGKKGGGSNGGGSNGGSNGGGSEGGEEGGGEEGGGLPLPSLPLPSLPLPTLPPILPSVLG